jgi:hypothetical protein
MSQINTESINSQDNTIKYINQSLSDLNITEKQEILQMIINSIDDKKIQTKGDGTQIRYADIPKNILQNISNYIKVQLEKKLEKIENFPSN